MVKAPLGLEEREIDHVETWEWTGVGEAPSRGTSGAGQGGRTARTGCVGDAVFVDKLFYWINTAPCLHIAHVHRQSGVECMAGRA